MRNLFDHAGFRIYPFAEVPCDRDLFIMSDKWMVEYEKAWREVFAGSDRNTAEIGYISWAAVNHVNASSIDLSWLPNIIDRFHEVRVSLPKSEFVICVGCWDYDERPHIFVKDGWVEQLHLRSYSVFALVDAIGVKAALTDGKLKREKLLELRDQIDRLAELHTDISFISFADSLLLKSNWTVGAYDSTVRYSYNPEVLIKVVAEIASVYRKILGMEIYAIITQGSNEFYNDPLLHISNIGHHISLNSLGLPFAQLQSIDRAVQQAIKVGDHAPCEIYLDESYYRSLKWRHQFDRDALPKAPYLARMSNGPHFYYCADRKTIIKNLQS